MQQNLLTNQFGNEKAHGTISEGIFREIGRIEGQQGNNAVAQLINVKPFEGRDGKNVRIGKDRLPIGACLLGLRLIIFIYLVNDQNNRNPCFFYILHQFLIIASLPAFDKIKDDVSILKGVGNEAHHHFLHHVGRIEHAGKIGIDDLEVVAVDDTLDAVSCGLRLGGHDGDLFADQLVHERALTHVGVADDVDKTGAMLFNVFYYGSSHIFLLFVKK